MVKTKVLISIVAIIVVLILGFLSFFVSLNIEYLLTGKTITRVNVLETPPLNCSVNLSKGLNMVSFPCETGLYDFDVAFSDEFNNTLNYGYFFIFEPHKVNDPWSSFNPSLPNWTVQANLNNLNRRNGYFVFMEEDGVYFAEGLRFPHTDISLKKGWNLVGYPSTNVKSVVEVLENINSSFVSLHSYQLVNNSKTWLHYYNNASGDLEFFVPGYAYWVFVEEDVVWRVNW